MDTVRCGIVGCGGIARWHIKSLGNIATAKLAAVCDPVVQAAESLGKEFDIPYYTDAEEMFAQAALDAVIICTPSGLHAPLAIQAMQHGLHVVVEKPLAITEESLAEVLAAEKATGKRLAVISQLRFSEGVQEAKKLLEEGALGKIVMADLSMKYYREPAYYANSNWRGTRAMDGGGALMNQGIHGLDLLYYLCGSMQQVQCYADALLYPIEVEDTLSACFTMANGGMGVLTATTSCYPGQARRLEICGTKGSLTIVEDKLTYLQTEDGHVLKYRGEEIECGASDPFAIGFALHQLQLENFVQSVLQGEALMVTAENAAGTLAIAFALYESAKTKLPVTVRHNKA